MLVPSLAGSEYIVMPSDSEASLREAHRFRGMLGRRWAGMFWVRLIPPSCRAQGDMTGRRGRALPLPPDQLGVGVEKGPVAPLNEDDE